MRFLRVVMVVLVLMTLDFVTVRQASAANPADLTSSYRYCPNLYFKAAYDGEPGWFLVNSPVVKDLSVAAEYWRSEDGSKNIGQLFIAKKFSENFGATLYLDNTWIGGDRNPRQELALDFCKKALGLGIIIPFQSEEEVSFGPRIKFGDLMVYATIAEDKDPCYGVSYLGKGYGIDLAAGREVYFVRVNKSFSTRVGTLTPEIRLKFTEQEDVYGVGLCFSPRIH